MNKKSQNWANIKFKFAESGHTAFETESHIKYFYCVDKWGDNSNKSLSKGVKSYRMKNVLRGFEINQLERKNVLMADF